MNPIRPGAAPPIPQSAQSQDAAKLAAQRAFFAALGRPQQPAAASPAAVALAPTPVARSAAPAPEGPGRILRPGSIIDIKV